MATAAPRGPGTGTPVVNTIRGCFHLYLSCLTLVISSPPFLAETRIGSISPLLKCHRWLPLPPEPRPNSLASSPSRTGTCGTFWCHLHHFTPVIAKYHPSPKCWVSFPISEPLCPPASLSGMPFPAFFTAKWPLTGPKAWLKGPTPPTISPGTPSGHTSCLPPRAWPCLTHPHLPHPPSLGTPSTFAEMNKLSHLATEHTQLERWQFSQEPLCGNHHNEGGNISPRPDIYCKFLSLTNLCMSVGRGVGGVLGDRASI